MKRKLTPEPEGAEKLVLQLYVSGMSQKSMEAISNVKKLCNEYIPNSFELEIIDIYKNPAMAKEQQIVFCPSLIKCYPLPKRIFIGTFSDADKMIKGLGISIK